MGKFYVGQRVRIKYSKGWPELAGEVGVIVAVCFDGGLRGRSEWFVAPDLWGSCNAPHKSLMGSTKFGPNSDQLEPITDSYDVVTWESCLWQPSPETV